MSIPHRDSPGYPWHARPEGHNALRLYSEGPEAKLSPLGEVQGHTFCRISAATADCERRRKVVCRSRRDLDRDEALLDARRSRGWFASAGSCGRRSQRIPGADGKAE